MSLIDELKRRNVFRVSAAYLALGWVVTQVTATVTPAFNLPASALTLVTWVGVIGFPFVVVFSWVYELTPEGLKRESEVDHSESITRLTARRLDFITIGIVALGVALFAYQQFGPHRMGSESIDRDQSTPTPSAATTTSAPAVAAPTASTALSVNDKSIAVLPFVNMSSDKEQDYFSDGISEELLNQLAQIPELRVIARTSSFAFKGKEIEIAEIAKRLNVAHVLEGSVRKSGNTLRITAQLIRTADSSHLWSQTYDRSLNDIFAVQDEISTAVVTQLKIKLLGAAPKAKVVDPKAYALYLQARQLARQGTPAGCEQSIALYQQVLAIDPAYASAWAGLANVYRYQGNNGLKPLDESRRLAREAANEALAIDPNLAYAHAELGRMAIESDRDLATAAEHFQAAVASAPEDLDVILSAAVFAGYLGRVDQNIALDQYAVARDPVNARAQFNLGLDYSAAGRQDDAIASMRTTLALSPGRLGAQYNMGVALLLKGDAAGALAAFQQETAESWRLMGLPIAYHALGRKAESDAALAELIRKYEKDAAYNVAYIFAFRGEPDHAFEWLDKAVAYQDGGLAGITIEPMLNSLHEDPRWLPFLRKIGQAPEQLAAIHFEVKLPK